MIECNGLIDKVNFKHICYITGVVYTVWELLTVHPVALAADSIQFSNLARSISRSLMTRIRIIYLKLVSSGIIFGFSPPLDIIPVNEFAKIMPTAKVVHGYLAVNNVDNSKSWNQSDELCDVNT